MKKAIRGITMLTFVAFANIAIAQQNVAPPPAKPSTAVAAPAPPAPAQEKPKTMKAEKFDGTIEKIDEMTKSIVVKDKKGEKTFAVTDKTKIVKGGKPMPFNEVKQGMITSIEYTMAGDRMIAEKVTLSAPEAALKAAPAKQKQAPKQ